MSRSRSKPLMISSLPESRDEGGLEPFEFANAFSLIHNKNVCRGSKCPIHNPSEHKMNRWPMILRETALIERRCTHGIGHPDPDSLVWMNKQFGKGHGVHGCDGCCRAT